MHGMFWGGGWMIVIWIGGIVLAFWVLQAWLSSPRLVGRSPGRPLDRGPLSPLDIARRSYASGEISREEYLTLVDDLTGVEHKRKRHDDDL